LFRALFDFTAIAKIAKVAPQLAVQLADGRLDYRSKKAQFTIFWSPPRNRQSWIRLDRALVGSQSPDKRTADTD
jgi:hypothetical protein